MRGDPVRRDSLIIVLAYTLAWGLLVVNWGIYWDDWTSVGVSPASLALGLREIGAVPWVAFFSAALYSMPLPGLVGHIIVFSAYLLSTLALHAILRRTPGLSRMDALVAALTFAVLPVNYARVALADLPYGLSLLAFLAATLLLIRYVEDGGLARRAVALGLYFSSFFTASLLVMYVMPMALAAFIVWKSASDATAVLRMAACRFRRAAGCLLALQVSVVRPKRGVRGIQRADPGEGWPMFLGCCPRSRARSCSSP